MLDLLGGRDGREEKRAESFGGYLIEKGRKIGRENKRVF